MLRGRKISRTGGAALALICAAQFVLQLDFSIVNVALPALLDEMRMPAADVQWVATGYALTFGSLLLVGGRAADIFGRRRLFGGGLTLFAIASLACGVAQSAVVLILARIVQGAAAAAVSPAALSLLTVLNPEGARRNRALGVWQAMTAGGAMTGVLAGGVLTQYLGWRSIFLVNLPVIAGLLAFVPHLVPEDEPRSERRIDVRGASLLTATLAALIFGLTNGEQAGFTSMLTMLSLVTAACCAYAYVRTEQRSADPMLPPSFLAAPARRAAAIAMFLMGGVIAGYVYFVSQYLQRVGHLGPALAGAALVPSTVTVVLTSTFATSRLLARTSVKTVLCAGLVAMAAGQLFLAQMSGGGGYAAVILPGLVLTAFGMGLALPAASIAMTNGVDPKQQGLAGALFVSSQQIGAAVGLALLATVAAVRTDGRAGDLSAGFGLSFLVAAGLALLGLAVTTRMPAK